VSLGSQITHMATNKGYYQKTILIILCINTKNITLDSRQWKNTPIFKRKLQLHRDNWLVDHKANWCGWNSKSEHMSYSTNITRGSWGSKGLT
jgi:hypothetical protein